MKPTNRFVKGSAIYTCRICERRTRQTGRGDNELVGLCGECYDLAGEENHLSDNGKLYDRPENVLALIAYIASKGGDTSYWDDIKEAAERQIREQA